MRLLAQRDMMMIELVVGLFVDRLIVLFRNCGKRIGLLLCVQKSSEHLVLDEPDEVYMVLG